MRVKVARTERKAGLGTAEVIQVVFIILKLCGLIDWPWVWVLSPIWITVGIILVAFLVSTLIVAVRVWRDR